MGVCVCIRVCVRACACAHARSLCTYLSHPFSFPPSVPPSRQLPIHCPFLLSLHSSSPLTRSCRLLAYTFCLPLLLFLSLSLVFTLLFALHHSPYLSCSLSALLYFHPSLSLCPPSPPSARTHTHTTERRYYFSHLHTLKWHYIHIWNVANVHVHVWNVANIHIWTCIHSYNRETVLVFTSAHFGVALHSHLKRRQHSYVDTHIWNVVPSKTF